MIDHTPGHATFDTVAKQALRVRRFQMAVATYIACGLFAVVCAYLGFLPLSVPAWWALVFGVVNLVFYLILRKGYNLRLSDPSMTEAQMMLGMFSLLALVYHTDAARPVFLMLFPVPFLFSALRLHFLQIARVGLFGVAGYAMVIGLLLVNHPERVHMGVEIVSLIALSAVMGVVTVLCAYISKVRGELSHSLETIRDMAQHDALTGVFNRRHLMESLEHQVQRCTRNPRHGLVLCLIDIDHFKKINDTYGHPAGDVVLVAVARCIGAAIRTVDYLARYGGEEFVVLLDLEDVDQWRAVSERARTQVEALQIAELPQCRVNISIGVAQYVVGETALSLLDRADKALYGAKAGGRNCVRFMGADAAGPKAIST